MVFARSGGNALDNDVLLNLIFKYKSPTEMLDRRSFLKAASPALLPFTWSIARAATRRPRVCFMGMAPAAAWTIQKQAIEDGLSRYGYLNGVNIDMNYYWPASIEAMIDSAVQIVDGCPDAILCPGSTQVAIYRKLTAKIPIIFAYHADPVGLGHVNSLAHPGRNISGTSMNMKDILRKSVSILKEVSPALKVVAFLSNPSNILHKCLFDTAQITASKLDLEMIALPIEGLADINYSFDFMKNQDNIGFMVPTSPITNSHQTEIAFLAKKSRIPGIFVNRANVFAGGLMSYGPSYADMYGRSAFFIDSVIKGNNIAEIPVEQVSRLDLIINEGAACGIGLTIPTSVLALANEIID